MRDLFEKHDSFSQIVTVPIIPIVEKRIETILTVAIPTCSRSNTLKETIESVLCQKSSIDVNILIVDNNPNRNDETERLITESYKYIDFISYYKNERNVGMAGNWNRLFTLCQTPYMILLHDDDVLLPNYLERMVLYLKNLTDVTAINAGKIRWTGGNNYYNKNRVDNRVTEYNKYCNFAYFDFGPPSGCLFKVCDVINEGGFSDESYPSIDYVLIEKLCLSGKKVYKLRETLMLYRVVANASENINTKIKWLDVDYNIKEQLGELLNLPHWYVRLVEYFEIKLRLRAIRKLQKNYKYRNWCPGGFLFLIPFKIYRFIYEIYLRKHDKQIFFDKSNMLLA